MRTVYNLIPWEVNKISTYEIACEVKIQESEDGWGGGCEHVPLAPSPIPSNGSPSD